MDTKSSGLPRFRWRRIGVFALTGLAVLALIPFRSLRGPVWNVWVVDEVGHPLQGITVRESYEDYSAEFRGGEEDLITDNQGHVRYLAKTLRASLLERLFVIASSAKGGVHSSFGPHDFVFAFGRGLEGVAADFGHVTDWTGSPLSMESHIVMHPKATFDAPK